MSRSNGGNLGTLEAASPPVAGRSTSALASWPFSLHPCSSQKPEHDSGKPRKRRNRSRIFELRKETSARGGAIRAPPPATKGRQVSGTADTLDARCPEKCFSRTAKQSADVAEASALPKRVLRSPQKLLHGREAICSRCRSSCMTGKSSAGSAEASAKCRSHCASPGESSSPVP